MGAIGGFAAEQFDVDLAVGLPAALGEDFLGPGDDRLADPLGLLQRIDAGDQATGGAAETVRIGGADLVPVGGRQAARAFPLFKGKPGQSRAYNGFHRAYLPDVLKDQED